MNVIFYRGGNEIGGNCIEIQSNTEKILLDIGKPITNKDMDGLIIQGSQYDGVLLSHAHIDHYGLINRVSKDTLVFCSAATKDILDINQIFLRQDKFNIDYSIFKSYESFKIGSFEVIPFLQDHSAFDSHGFLIKVEGKIIIYTGDFRNHGRKKYVYKKLMNLFESQKVNLLITEGTTLNRKYEKMKTEDEIVDEFILGISKSKGLVTVCFSPQNIDRLVSIYKAARKTGIVFVVDIYTAYLLSKLSKHAKIPNVDYSNLNVYYPKNQVKKLKDLGKDNILKSFERRKIILNEIKNNPNKYILMIRPSLMYELEELEISLLIFSMWKGYLKNEDMKRMKKWINEKNAQFQIIHTSGHTSVDFFIKFIDEINPERLKIIHTEGISEDCLELKKYGDKLFLVFCPCVITLLTSYFRRKRLKKAKIDVNKYFDFKGEIKTEIITLLVIILAVIILKSLFLKVFGLLMIIFSLWILGSNTIDYLKKKPLMVINDSGIKININAVYAKIDMLMWSEVEEVFTYNDNGYKSIEIYSSNMKEILSKISLFRRYMLGSTKIITIPKNAISMDIDDLYIEIKSRMTN
jgi:ribonuclease J